MSNDNKFLQSFKSSENTKEVMRISAEGVRVNPEVSVDDAAKVVIACLEEHIKHVTQAEVLKERAACEEKLCRLQAENAALLATQAELVEALKHAANCVQTNYLPDQCGHDWDEVIAKAVATSEKTND